jgi:biofilm protein TabA
MIIDTLANASKYYGLHPAFAKAFAFIKSHNDFENSTETNFKIADNLKAFIAEFHGVTKENSLKKFECHNKNIDIQYCIKGKEIFGWKPRENCHNMQSDYNTEKDVLFFNDAPDMFFELCAGQFVIFFPEDVHAPGIGDGEIKKLVVKVLQ